MFSLFYLWKIVLKAYLFVWNKNGVKTFCFKKVVSNCCLWNFNQLAMYLEIEFDWKFYQIFFGFFYFYFLMVLEFFFFFEFYIIFQRPVQFGRLLRFDRPNLSGLASTAGQNLFKWGLFTPISSQSFGMFQSAAIQ